MADRSVIVRFRAEVADFKRDVAEAGRAVQATVGAIPASQREASRSLEGLVQSARDNRAAWDSTGKVLLTVGGAITGVGLAALRTGIQYNTLRQTTTAALTTILGSASAAADQMDRLDDFARTSPFARQVFIQAQQQLLGFGMEADRVLPTLDAIQNAVAAVGGSNQDIAEIANVLAKVQGTGKITAITLNELGIRGVDAATLIGEQMGKTGAQIREDITDGALGAQVALDALVAGMQQRFGGAAANVKETFEGALDRVKAAWRDLSSELASGLVNPEGGGLLIDWLNGFADAMRQFQGLPEPVKAGTAALVGLTGAAATLGGGFLLLFPRLVSVYDQLHRMGPAGVKVQDVLRRTGQELPRLTRLLGYAAAAMLAAQASGMLLERTVSDVTLESRELRRMLDSLVRGTGDIETAFGDMSTWMDFGTAKEGAEGLRDELQRLVDPNLGQRIQQPINDALGMISTTLGRGRYAERLAQIGQELATIAENDLPRATERFAALWREAGGDSDTARRLLTTMPEFRAVLVDVAESAGYTANEITLMRLATGQMTITAREAVDPVEDLTAAAQMQAEAAEEAAKAHAEWAGMVVDAMAAFVDLTGAYDSVIEKNKELAEETAAATKSSKDSWEDYYDGTTVSMQEWIAALEEQVAAQQRWADDMTVLSERVNTTMTGHARDAANEMIDYYMDLGPRGAAEVENLRNATDEELQRTVDLWIQRGDQMGAGLADAVHSHRAELRVEDRASLVLDTIHTKIFQLPSRRVVNIDVRTNETVVRSNQTGWTAPAAARADGGVIPGWSPHARADNILVAATAGEYMQQKAAVDFWGLPVMDAMNRRDVAAVRAAVTAAPVQALAYGGLVGSRGPATSADISAAVRDALHAMEGARPMEVVGAKYTGTVHQGGDAEHLARRTALKTRDTFTAQGLGGGG